MGGGTTVLIPSRACKARVEGWAAGLSFCRPRRSKLNRRSTSRSFDTSASRPAQDEVGGGTTVLILSRACKARVEGWAAGLSFCRPRRSKLNRRSTSPSFDTSASRPAQDEVGGGTTVLILSRACKARVEGWAAGLSFCRPRRSKLNRRSTSPSFDTSASRPAQDEVGGGTTVLIPSRACKARVEGWAAGLAVHEAHARRAVRTRGATGSRSVSSLIQIVSSG